MHQPLVPAIVFVVFFWVYRDQGSLKPYLDQQKKQKTIKGGATVCVRKLSYDPMNRISKPTKDHRIYTHKNAKSTWVPDLRPQIVFVVVFWVYKDLGFIRPCLCQPEKNERLSQVVVQREKTRVCTGSGKRCVSLACDSLYCFFFGLPKSRLP